MLVIEQLRNIQDGTLVKGFFVRNKIGKVLAIGAKGCFVVMKAKRYAKDKMLVGAVAKLTGLQPRI